MVDQLAAAAHLEDVGPAGRVEPDARVRPLDQQDLAGVVVDDRADRDLGRDVAGHALADNAPRRGLARLPVEITYQHVETLSAEGGFLPKRRRELDDTTAARADLIVTNLRDSLIQEQQGDLFEPMEKGLIKIDDIYELGELGTEKCPGRTGDDQITYHKNGNGTGVADVGLAGLAYKLAKEAGRGMEIDLTGG